MKFMSTQRWCGKNQEKVRQITLFKLDYIHNVIYVKNKSFSTRLLTTRSPEKKNVCDGSEGYINSYRIKKKLVIC